MNTHPAVRQVLTGSCETAIIVNTLDIRGGIEYSLSVYLLLLWFHNLYCTPLFLNSQIEYKIVPAIKVEVETEFQLIPK